MEYVAAVVTYEGNPVENINVLIKPESGRTPHGRTDANGKYEIEFIAGEKGGKVGPTIVSLEWPMGADPLCLLSRNDSSMKSALALDLKPGRNPSFDIPIQPDPAGEKTAAKKPKFIVDRASLVSRRLWSTAIKDSSGDSAFG
ncbi:MAG: hypothetical protein U0872_12750 [Planctomycetaceae bacterium]